MTKMANSRRISLQVNAMSPSGAGWWVRSWAAITASRACAIIASRVQRRQEVQRRTWCSSSPGQAFACLERLLDRPAVAGDPDQLTQRDDVRGIAAVERQLAGVAVATRQQPPARGGGVLG